MTKKTKIWYGIAAFTPIGFFTICTAGFIVFFVFLIAKLIQGESSNEMPQEFIFMIIGIYGLFILGFIIGFVAKIIFIVKAVLSTKIDTEKKLLWSFLMFYTTIAIPFYWYYHIWKEEPVITG